MRASKRIACSEPTVSGVEQEALATIDAVAALALAGIERDVGTPQEVINAFAILPTLSQGGKIMSTGRRAYDAARGKGTFCRKTLPVRARSCAAARRRKVSRVDV